MHELGIVVKFVHIAKEYAVKNNAQKVNKIVLQVGELTGIVPRFLQIFYPAVVEGTILEGSELVIEMIEGKVVCTDCGKTYNPRKTDLKCPNCASQRCDIIDGRSMFVAGIEIAQDSLTAAGS